MPAETGFIKMKDTDVPLRRKQDTQVFLRAVIQEESQNISFSDFIPDIKGA
jgi:hypothetical protein